MKEHTNRGHHVRLGAAFKASLFKSEHLIGQLAIRRRALFVHAQLLHATMTFLELFLDDESGDLKKEEKGGGEAG